MIFEAVVDGENLKFKCSCCEYESKILSNVLKHCGSNHSNFDNRILIQANWIFSDRCSDILNYMKTRNLACSVCERVFTTNKTFSDHVASECEFSAYAEEGPLLLQKSTQTPTEYMLLEEEVIVLRRECRNLTQGLNPDSFIAQS